MSGTTESEYLTPDGQTLHIMIDTDTNWPERTFYAWTGDQRRAVVLPKYPVTAEDIERARELARAAAHGKDVT